MIDFVSNNWASIAGAWFFLSLLVLVFNYCAGEVSE